MVFVFMFSANLNTIYDCALVTSKCVWQNPTNFIVTSLEHFSPFHFEQTLGIMHLNGGKGESSPSEVLWCNLFSICRFFSSALIVESKRGVQIVAFPF